MNFETFISENQQFLIEQYNISYATSFGQYFSPIKEKNKSNSKYAFAPGFSYELKNSYKQETDSILWDKNYLSLLQQPNTLNFAKELEQNEFHSYIGHLANEKNFKEMAPNANMLFIGTHGFLNDLNPTQSYLQFSNSHDSIDNNDNQLFASEIYGINLNTELAFLTACNTGIGSIRKGEGMISLAHAFNSAGCSNIIHSLWSIDENSSIEIGKVFLDKYFSSKDPSSALREAKLQYIRSNDNQLNHPFYWGGLVLKSQVSAKSNRRNYFFLIGIGISMILLLALSKFFRNS